MTSQIPVRSNVEALASACYQNPRTVLGCWLALFAVSLLGLCHLAIETNTESVLDRASDEWRFYERSEALFGTDEGITVALHSSTPFDVVALGRVFDLTRTLSAIDGVRRVDSLASVPIVESDRDGGIRLDPLMRNEPPRSQAEADAIGNRALADPVLPRLFVSTDGRVLAMNLLLDPHAIANPSMLLRSVYEVLSSKDIWISGVPVFRAETDAQTRVELATFIPVTVLVVAAILFGLFRSLAAAVLPVAISGAATCIVMGAMGALGVPLSISTVILPSVFLAMGCAYSLHLLMETAGISGPHELGPAIVRVARPLALSGLTTAIGFAAVAVVPIDALRELGGFGALGTFTLVLAVLTAGPAYLAIWQPVHLSTRFIEWVQNSLQGPLLGFVARNRRSVLLAWTIAALCFGIGALQVRVETDVTKWFPKGGAVRDSYDSIRSTLSGISPMNIVVKGKGPDAILEPEVLEAIARLTLALEEERDVGKVVSIVDPLRELRRQFVPEAGGELPKERGEIAQYMLLLESKEQFRDLMASDRSAANVMLRVNNNGSEHLLRLAEEVTRWWKAHGIDSVEVRTTGIMYEFARAQRAIALGQLQGLGLDLATIGLILLAIFRIPKLAVIALIPNVIPLLVVFGFLGGIHSPLDAGTVVVGNLALGIAVDETVFILTAFMIHRSEEDSLEGVLAESFRQVLPALIATTTVVAVGFAVLGVSDFAFTQKLGALTSGVMVVCVVANVTLLPALLLTFGNPRRTN